MWCPTNVDSVNSEAENSNVQESQEEDKFSKQQEVVDIDGLLFPRDSFTPKRPKDSKGPHFNCAGFRE